MIPFIFTAIFTFSMQILLGWLIYRQRGKAQQDEKNSPVITDGRDAFIQRYIDRYKRKKSGK